MNTHELRRQKFEIIAPVPGPPAGAWAWAVATVLGVGHIPFAPGTWGALATLLLWWAVGTVLPPAVHTATLAVIILALIAFGIPAATRVAREKGRIDPAFVVVDEAAGQMVAVLAAPLGWKTLLAGFILFRVFDILKPPPLRRLERLPKGTGIMLDDVGAGVYSLLMMQLLLYFGVL